MSQGLYIIVSLPYSSCSGPQVQPQKTPRPQTSGSVAPELLPQIWNTCQKCTILSLLPAPNLSLWYIQEQAQDSACSKYAWMILPLFEVWNLPGPHVSKTRPVKWIITIPGIPSSLTTYWKPHLQLGSPLPTFLLSTPKSPIKNVDGLSGLPIVWVDLVPFLTAPMGKLRSGDDGEPRRMQGQGKAPFSLPLQ